MCIRDRACDAIMILGERYAAYARELAAKEEDAGRREELLPVSYTHLDVYKRQILDFPAFLLPKMPICTLSEEGAAFKLIKIPPVI